MTLFLTNEKNQTQYSKRVSRSYLKSMEICFNIFKNRPNVKSMYEILAINYLLSLEIYKILHQIEKKEKKKKLFGVKFGGWLF